MDAPTYFGEIVDFRSRAVDLEYDDFEVEYEPKFDVAISLTEVKVDQPDLLIVAIGPNACGFVDIYLSKESRKKLGVVNVKPSELKTVGLHDKFDAVHLEVDGNLAVAHCQKQLDSECIADVVVKMFSAFQQIPKCVVVVTSIFTNSYLSDMGVPRDGLINILCNNVDSGFNQQLQQKFQPLPVPNIVDRLAAGVLIHCQSQKVRASCFMVITEHLVKDIDTVKAFKPLLKVEPLKPFAKAVKTEQQQLQRFADSGPLLCPSGNMFV